MEETHKHVRENVKGAMHRQKNYYDQKLSWQSFQPGDQVFVFFANVKPVEDFVDISFLSYPGVLLVVYLFDHS
jgi:hypothetical protein